jgi:hypothetical protein
MTPLLRATTLLCLLLLGASLTVNGYLLSGFVVLMLAMVQAASLWRNV